MAVAPRGAGDARVTSPSALVPPDARLRIEAAIADVERRTAGEIVVVVAAQSADYASVPWRLGVVLAAVALLGLALHLPVLPAAALLAAQAVALGIGLALGRLPAVRHHLVSDVVQDARVAESARRSFAEHGLAGTTGRTGILIFVSLLEHRVVVLADEGIHRVLGPEERWEDVVALALAGIREGRTAGGLEDAVRHCGQILAAHVPASAADVDELRNRVVLED